MNPYEYKVLTGHTSPETAYVVEDYPYGYRLRCSMRYWIETKPSFGQRVMMQSSNPKRIGLVWNKPHPGTYSAVAILYINPENGHCESDGLHKGRNLEGIVAFEEKYGPYLDDYQKMVVSRMRTKAEYQRANPAKLREYVR